MTHGTQPQRCTRRAGLERSYQRNTICPALTVFENRRLAAQARLTNLGAQLSGGEQQVLSIGRALMTHPELIVLDEASEGLAPLIWAEIWRVIAQIRSSGMATLVVDCDYRKPLSQSDQALVLQKGQVVLHGPSQTLAVSQELSSYPGV